MFKKLTVLLSAAFFTSFTTQAFSSTAEVEKAAASLVKQFGEGVSKNKEVYSAYLEYADLPERFNFEGLARLMQATGPDPSGWKSIVERARANGISDKAIGTLAKRYGQGIASEALKQRLDQITAAHQIEDGEAKAFLVESYGTNASRGPAASTALLIQFLDFIERDEQRKAFIIFKRRNPSGFREFLKISSREERAKVYEEIMQRYGNRSVSTAP